MVNSCNHITMKARYDKQLEVLKGFMKKVVVILKACTCYVKQFIRFSDNVVIFLIIKSVLCLTVRFTVNDE